MPEENVGGISVQFVANAEQLKAELTQLEQRLRQFDRAHGKQSVNLTTQMRLPSDRELLSARRDISQRFEKAGVVQTKIQLIPPSSRDLTAFTREVASAVNSKPISMRVIGNFEWGQRPPESITVPVTGGGGGGGGSQTAATAHQIVNRPSTPIAAAPPSRGPVTAPRKASAPRRPPIAPPTTVAGSSSSNSAKAAAQVKPISDPEFFQDYSNADILEELASPGRREWAERVRGEAARRGLSIPAAQPRPGSRSLTGGATGMFGPRPIAVPHFSTTGRRPPQAAQVGGLARAGAFGLPAADVYNPYIRGQGGVAPSPRKIQQAGLTEDQMAENLRRVLSRSTPGSISAGRSWYREAGQLTQAIGQGTGLGRQNVAAATAVFSSQAAWEKNVRNAQNFFDALRAGARTLEATLPYMKRAGGDRPTGEQIQKALDVAFAPGSAAIERRLRGPKGENNPKVAEFWQALVGNPDAAVIDRHQAMMMSGGRFKNPANASAARPFQNALRRVAAERGETPAETQAISWATVLGHEVSGPDPFGQLGARGYTGELTWGERLKNMRARPLDAGAGQPLVLSTRGAQFARGVEDRAPVDVDPRRLVPFRELDREVSPRLQQRGFDPNAFGKDYLNRLTEDIRQNGLREPVTLEHDEIGQAQVTDGNHRLAAALRLGLQKIPVAVKPARGLLTGNTGPASAIEDLIGARGFNGGGFREETYRNAQLREQHESMQRANEARLAYAQSRQAEREDRAKRASRPLEGDAVEERNRKLAAILGLPHGDTGPTGARGFASPRGSFGRLTGTNYEPIHANLYGETGALLPGAAEYGARPQMLEDAARQRHERALSEMHARVQQPYGGFTYDPRQQQFLEQQPGRKSGPYISGVGQTVRISEEQARDVGQLRAAIDRLRQIPENAALLRSGATIGGFNTGAGQVDLDINQIDQTRAAARATQRRRPGAEGAYDLATGEGVFGSRAMQMRYQTREAVRSALEGASGTMELPYTRYRSQPPLQQRPRGELQAAEYTPTGTADVAAGERQLRAATGQYGLEAQRLAEEGLWQPPRRRKRSGVGVTTSRDRTRASGADVADMDLSGVLPDYEPGAERRRGARLIDIQQRTTTRALGTYLSGALSSGAGGAQARELAREAARANTEAINAHKRLSAAVIDEAKYERDLRSATGSSRKEIIEKLNAQRETVQKLGEEYQKAGSRADVLTEAASRAGGPLRNVLAGFGGQLVGGLAIGAGFAAANAGIEAFTGLMGNAIEKMTGFTGTSNKVVNALAEQTRAQNGLADVATNQAFIQAGLGKTTADVIRPILEERAAVTAGNQAFGDQVDLIRAAVTLRRQNAEAASGRSYGLGITPGAIPGITGSTGGILGTPIGAQTPMVEQLAALTPGSTRGEQLATQAGGAGIGAVGGALAGAAAGAGIGLLGGPFAPITSTAGAIIGAIGGGLAGAGIGGTVAPGLAGLSDAQISAGQFNAQGNYIGGAGGTPATRILASGRGASVPNGAGGGLSSAEKDRYAAFSLAVLDMTDAAEKASPGISRMAHATQQASDAQIAATSKVLTSLGVADDEVKSLARSRFAIVNDQGGAANRDQARQFLRASSQGAGMPDPDEFYRDLRNRTIPARQFAAAATGELERRQNAMNFALSQTASPLPAAGSTVPGGLAGLRGTNISAAGISSQSFAGNIMSDRSQIDAYASKWRTETLDYVTSMLGGTKGAAAGADIQKLQGLGQRATGLQQFIAGAQNNVQTAQYNEQIYQQQRALTDINQILGRQGATQGDNLGLLERQMISYQRQGAMIQLNTARLGQQSGELSHQNDLLGLQAQQLQLAQSQRQINFQRSLAGFVSPGQTPAEIAARQKEAQLEADYSQKQLDIRKEQFDLQKQQVAIGAKQLEQNAQLIELQSKQVPLSFNIEDIGFARQARDLAKGIDLSKLARDTQIAIAGAQEELAGVQTQIGQVTADLQTYLQEAATLSAGVISDEANAIATFGKKAQDMFGAVSTAYSTAFNKYIQSVIASVQAGASQLGGGARNTSYDTRSHFGGPQQFAGGGLKDVSSSTGIVVGEAGPETIAILRNPRTLPTGGSDGGLANGPTNISITINTTGEVDEQKLAALVARKVEEIQSRRISLLGLRGVS